VKGGSGLTKVGRLYVTGDDVTYVGDDVTHVYVSTSPRLAASMSQVMM
jgi:hypothetical protein